MSSQALESVNWPERIVELFAKWLNILSAVWLGSVVILIFCDVIGREVFSAPIHGTNEIVSNSVLSVLFLMLPRSILTDGSLRTTILYGKVGARGKSLIDAASYSMALILFAVIGIGSWPNMIEGWAIGEQEGSGIVNIPVYPIRTLVVFVCAVGVAVALVMIWHSLTRPGVSRALPPSTEGD